MNIANNAIIDIYSIIILTIIYNQSSKHPEKDSFQNKLFLKMIYITFIMLVADIFSRFDGNVSSLYPTFNYWGNLIIFSVNPISSSIWLKYVHFQIFQEEWRTKKLSYPLLMINAINIIMVILTQFFGLYYYIDRANIYHRGPFFLVGPIITVFILTIAFILIFVNRKKIEKKYYFALLFFSLPPLIALVLQVRFYGLSLMLNALVISILIVFLNIQNRSIYTDYLTGVNNRRKLQMYMKNKVQTSSREKTFAAIMIDLNDFKLINDSYGHDIGDNALQTTVELLNGSIRSKDFIARYGGDEFWIVLDTSDINCLEDIIDRILASFKKFNQSKIKPYRLEISCGYGIYDYDSNMSLEEFQKHIDNLMYENKKIIKKAKNNIPINSLSTLDMEIT